MRGESDLARRGAGWLSIFDYGWREIDLVYLFRAIKVKERLWKEWLAPRTGILESLKVCTVRDHRQVHTSFVSAYHWTYCCSRDWNMPFLDRKVWRFAAKRRASSRSTAELGETTGSHSVRWTLLQLKKPTSSSECCLMLKEDSFHTELTPRKLASSSARLSRSILAKRRSHIPPRTTAEPSDSLTQTLALAILSR